MQAAGGYWLARSAVKYDSGILLDDQSCGYPTIARGVMIRVRVVEMTLTGLLLDMPNKHVVPSLSAESFSCPHCGALAHQTWYEVYLDDFDRDKRPQLQRADFVDYIRSIPDMDATIKQKWIDRHERIMSGKPSSFRMTQGIHVYTSFNNLWASRCFSCDNYGIWINDRLVYPHIEVQIDANADLPPDILRDFSEARQIADGSPRGAAALLRLAIQKICIALGLPGKNLDSDIAALVAKGLDPQIQRALDIVRVIGNEAVHPGTIDLKDNKETAVKLFEVVNLIAETMISRPKRIEQLYGSLPPAKLEAIARRDAKDS